MNIVDFQKNILSFALRLSAVYFSDTSEMQILQKKIFCILLKYISRKLEVRDIRYKEEKIELSRPKFQIINPIPAGGGSIFPPPPVVFFT